jgi:hypothetical protein
VVTRRGPISREVRRRRRRRRRMTTMMVMRRTTMVMCITTDDDGTRHFSTCEGRNQLDLPWKQAFKSYSKEGARWAYREDADEDRLALENISLERRSSSSSSKVMARAAAPPPWALLSNNKHVTQESLR